MTEEEFKMRRSYNIETLQSAEIKKWLPRMVSSLHSERQERAMRNRCEPFRKNSAAIGTETSSSSVVVRKRRSRNNFVSQTFNVSGKNNS